MEKELNRKTKPRYLGPFKINRQTQAGAYVIEELDGTISRQGIAAFRIIPYISRFSPELAQLAHIQERSDQDLEETRSPGNFTESATDLDQSHE